MVYPQLPATQCFVLPVITLLLLLNTKHHHRLYTVMVVFPCLGHFETKYRCLNSKCFKLTGSFSWALTNGYEVVSYTFFMLFLYNTMSLVSLAHMVLGNGTVWQYQDNILMWPCHTYETFLCMVCAVDCLEKKSQILESLIPVWSNVRKIMKY